jgi:hypothetical protein
VWELPCYDLVDLAWIKVTWLTNKTKIWGWNWEENGEIDKKKTHRLDSLFNPGLKWNYVRVILTWFNWLGRSKCNLNDFKNIWEWNWG